MSTSPISHRESIWEYPRTPVVEPVRAHISVIHGGICIADTFRALRVVTNGHAPSYYLPPEDIRMELMQPSRRKTFCEWKGVASHYDLIVDDEVVRDAAWCFPEPARAFEPLRDYVAFYPERVDSCLIDGQLVRPEPQSSRGGWITPNLEGPFR